MKKISIAVLLILLVTGTKGQVIEDTESQQPKTNNIGIGIGMVYLIADSDWASAVHLHYSKCLGQKQRFSIGTGMDLLLGDHKHTSVSLAVEYSPLAGLSLGYGPGLEFPLSNDVEHGVHFTQHIELSYEFDLHFIHIGPMIEYEFSKGDQHLVFGIHTGFSI